MGAISGDVNSLSMRCATVADLQSRPIASMKSGDKAWVEALDGTSVGASFFLNLTSAAPVSAGVIKPSVVGASAGRWLSEALYGTPPVSTGQVYQELSGDVTLAQSPANTVLAETAALTPAVDSVIAFLATYSVNMGANATQATLGLYVNTNGAGWVALASAKGGASAAATKTGGGSFQGRIPVVAGSSYAFRLVGNGDTATANIHPETRATDGAQLKAEIVYV